MNDLPRIMRPAIRAQRVRRFRRRLLDWYRENGRTFPWRSPKEPLYRLVVVEVLLQRTQAETVAKAYRQFFRTYPSWRQLACATEGELSEVLRPLGLWQRRARSLMALATAVAARGGRVPRDRRRLEELPGVGQYIANAIQLVRGIENAPLLDSNLARVLERYFGPRSKADIRYDPYLQALAWRVADCEEPLSLNWAALDLAAKICTAREPKCRECPLRRGCKFASGTSVAKRDETSRKRLKGRHI